MAQTIDINSFLSLLGQVPAVDVRSPAEYSQAHIPGVLSLPLFSDEERAIVGTLYKHQGKEKAAVKGMDIAGPKMSEYVRQAEAITAEKRIMVHCWRGGMRSAAMAFTLGVAGFETMLLEGGYRSYRRLVQELLAFPWRLIVLGGMTGTGKTEILQHLKGRGEQVIDLEGLANHKGSAFGSIGQMEQPSTEHFSNMLGMELFRLDPQKVVWVEDESHEIGRIGIPHVFYLQMRAAPLIFVEVSRELRAERLVSEYTGVSDDQLKQALEIIGRHLGGQQLKEALQAIDAGDHRKAALISLHYYDKAYSFGLAKRDQQNVIRLGSNSHEMGELTDAVLKEASVILENK